MNRKEGQDRKDGICKKKCCNHVVYIVFSFLVILSLQIMLLLLTGGILKWEQQCRIVHMCTRRYLAVNKKGEVTLIADNDDPSTMFRLYAVIRVLLLALYDLEFHCLRSRRFTVM